MRSGQTRFGWPTGGSTPRAEQAILEIHQADSWGLRASAFELPKLGAPPTDVEALAAAEIKLSFAILKYARAARGGRLDPAAVSRKFDQKPPVYDPGSLLLAVAEHADIAAYLRQLHPRHEQFARLRQALLAARAAPARRRHGQYRSAPDRQLGALALDAR